MGQFLLEARSRGRLYLEGWQELLWREKPTKTMAKNLHCPLVVVEGKLLPLTQLLWSAEPCEQYHVSHAAILDLDAFLF